MFDERRDGNDRPPAYTQATALGFATGLRSMVGIAVIGQTIPGAVRIATRLLSAGELVGDKLPKIGSRLGLAPLSARVVIGTIVGYIVCRQGRRSPWIGALLGAVGALAGSFGGYYARKALSERAHLPDPLVAVAEDALALSLGRRFRL